MDCDAVAERLAWLRAAPDGALYEGPAGPLRALVIKRGGQVGLYFANPDGTLDGPMSRIDLERPLHLAAEYTQALMLTLLWVPDPRQVCVIGLGGGRIPLVLHTHLPDTTIVSVDIDPAFTDLSERFFGLACDQRQRVVIADGREYLARERADPPFQILLLDAFSDQSDNLDHLATVEFYALCRRRLARGGVAAVNLLRSDEHLAAKAAAFAANFPRPSVVALKHSLVLFGSDQPRLSQAQIRRRAEQIQARLRFEFPFTERAGMLRPFRPAEEGLGGASPLRDCQIDQHSGM